VIPFKDVNPTRRPAVLTMGLIGACVLVFAYQLSRPDDLSFEGRQAFICEFGLIADHLLGGAAATGDGCVLLNQEQDRYLGLVSSQFLHADLMHLGFNMLFLWVFGNNVEDRLGRIRFLPFYLLCGAIAALAQAAVDPDSTIPLIGASGAISGVLGAYLVLYPRVRIGPSCSRSCSCPSSCPPGSGSASTSRSSSSTSATRPPPGAGTSPTWPTSGASWRGPC
jgi:membrane associated rhomboid family serine protease